MAFFPRLDPANLITERTKTLIYLSSLFSVEKLWNKSLLVALRHRHNLTWIRTMSDEEHQFESKADAGASKTYPQQAGTIRKNGYIVIKNRPCKVGFCLIFVIIVLIPIIRSSFYDSIFLDFWFFFFFLWLGCWSFHFENWKARSC